MIYCVFLPLWNFMRIFFFCLISSVWLKIHPFEKGTHRVDHLKKKHYCLFFLLICELCLCYDVQSEEEMLRDQIEREQLEKNLRERDAANTRKVFYFILQAINIWMFWLKGKVNTSSISLISFSIIYIISYNQY